MYGCVGLGAVRLWTYVHSPITWLTGSQSFPCTCIHLQSGIHAQLALLHRLQGDEAAAQAAVQKVIYYKCRETGLDVLYL